MSGVLNDEQLLENISAGVEKYMEDSSIPGPLEDKFSIFVDANNQITITSVTGTDPIPALSLLRSYSLQSLQTQRRRKRNKSKLQASRVKSLTNDEILELESSGDPEEGDMVFNTDIKIMQYWNGTIWVSL